MSIVTSSLDYYDKHCEKFNSFVSKIKYFKYEIHSGDMERNIIRLYNGNKKEIFKSRIEHIGQFYTDYKLWAWAWAIPFYNKNVSYTTKKLFDYGLSMDPHKENLFLRTELITSRFRITDPVQLDIHIAMAAYLSKIPYILKIKWNPLVEPDVEGYIEFITNTKESIAGYMYIYLLDYKLKK